MCVVAAPVLVRAGGAGRAGKKRTIKMERRFKKTGVANGTGMNDRGQRGFRPGLPPLGIGIGAGRPPEHFFRVSSREMVHQTLPRIICVFFFCVVFFALLSMLVSDKNGIVGGPVEQTCGCRSSGLDACLTFGLRFCNRCVGFLLLFLIQKGW